RLLRDQGQEGGRPGRESAELVEVMERSYTPYGTAVQPFAQPQRRLLRLDFLLLAATIGLIAFSVVTLNGAIAGGVNGGSGYYVVRQVGYALVGLALMFLIARIDY